jgi:N,N'-diacetyllegionaminate synthase|tara:strand:- start:1687 stop:2703 length:1017 start_codon:yes stop_codon:yes gene_type:complete
VIFSKSIKINKNYIISQNNPTFIIAEVGVNHEGNYLNCLRLVNEANKAGANAVKIQLAKAEINYKANSKSFKIYKKSELNKKEIVKLYAYAKKKKILLFATCDEYYFQFVKRLNQKLFKISSSQAQDLNMISKINSIQRPMLISTGMNTSTDIVELIKFLNKLKNKKIILMHCVSKYPLKINDVNLDMLNFYKKKFAGIIGYSDHTSGIKACVYAVLKGARVIEKHFTLDNKKSGYDHKISLNFSNFKKMVLEIREAEAAIGTVKKNDKNKQRKEVTSFKRTHFINKKLKKGQKLKISDIYTKRIGKNCSIIDLLRLIGKKTTKDLSIYSKIYKKDFI